MNSPEEKAKELVRRFSPLVTIWDCYNDMPEDEDNIKEDAKKCSLICVDEIISQLNSFADYWDLKNGEWYRDELAKTEKVKEAIQSL